MLATFLNIMKPECERKLVMKYYLFAILPNIKILLGIIIAVLFLFAIIGFIAIASENETMWVGDEKKELNLKSVYLCFIFGWILSFIITFIPNQKQLAFVIAAPYIIENQQLQDASKNSVEIIKLGTEYLKQTLSNEIERK